MRLSAYTPPSGFSIKGTADLDGDGERDVLLVNAGGTVTELQLVKNGVGQTPVMLPSWAGWTLQGFVDVLEVIADLRERIDSGLRLPIKKNGLQRRLERRQDVLVRVTQQAIG